MSDPQDSDAPQLTERQQQILATIHASLARDGRAPTIREIAEICGISSTSVVNYHLVKLREAGLLEKGRFGASRDRRPTGAAFFRWGEPVTVRTPGGELVTGELVAGATA